jgi:hypothetical protein
MSVLDRKLFRGVARLKHGGSPNVDHETGFLKSPSVGSVTDSMRAFEPFIEEFTDKIYPQKTDETLREEAKNIFDTDFSGQRALIEEQKREDVASSLISFGARLAGGRGKSLDILASAAAQTVPELAAMRRATRKDESLLVQQEQQADKQIAKYVLDQKQQNALNKANAYSSFVFENLGFLHDVELKKKQQELDNSTTTSNYYNKETNQLELITMQTLLDDLAKPRNQRIYREDDSFDKPFLAWDDEWGSNRYFNTKSDWTEAAEKDPKRYSQARAMADMNPVKKLQYASYKDSKSGAMIEQPVRVMKDGRYQIIQMKEDGSGPLLDALGKVMWEYAGATTATIAPRTDVETTEVGLGKSKMQLEIFAGIQQFDASLDAIDTVMRNLTDKKTRAGIVGTLFEAGQKLEGMVSDLFSVTDGNALVDFVKEDLASNSMPAAVKDAVLNPNSEFNSGFFDDLGSSIYGKGFDPAFAENRVLVNAIAYSVARARKKTGRLNLDDVRNARESLTLGGFTSADTVLAGLTAVRRELYTANEALKIQYTSDMVGGTYPSSYMGHVPFNADSFPSVAVGEDGKLKLVIKGLGTEVEN